MRKAMMTALVAAYGFFWLGGVGAYWIFGGPPEHVSWTAPLFLALAGMLVLAGSAPGDIPRILLCGVVGFASEVLGVHTNLPFGAYAYTHVLRPHLFGVPVVMIAAWLILLVYIQDMLRKFDLPAWERVSVAALWMTAIDLVIDPLAAGPLQYWTWEHPGWYYGIPATNFLGWVVVSLIAFAVAGGRWQPNRYARWVGLSVVLFFVSVALAKGLLLAAAAGVGLCAVHGAVAYVEPNCASDTVSSQTTTPTL